MGNSVKTPLPKFIRQNNIITATLYFSENNSVLNGINLIVISMLKSELSANSNMIVFVDGFASGDGKDEHNLSLSQRRRDEVLTKLSLDKEKTGGQPYGESRAAMTETASDAATLKYQRQLNRKVTVVMTPQASPNLFKLKITPPDKPDTDHRKLKLLGDPVPSAPSLGDNLKKKLKVDSLQKILNPCVGDYCFNIPGSVGGSIKMNYLMNTGTPITEILSDQQEAFMNEQDERIRLMDDLKNNNRVF